MPINPISLKQAYQVLGVEETANDELLRNRFNHLQAAAPINHADSLLPPINYPYFYNLIVEARMDAKRSAYFQELGEAAKSQNLREKNLHPLYEMSQDARLLNLQDPKTGWTIAHVAVAADNLQELERLIQAKVALNIPNILGLAPVFYAKSTQALKILINNRVDIYESDKNGKYPFEVLAEHLNPTELLSLLTHPKCAHRLQADLIMRLSNLAQMNTLSDAIKNELGRILALELNVAVDAGNSTLVSMISMALPKFISLQEVKSILTKKGLAALTHDQKIRKHISTSQRAILNNEASDYKELLDAMTSVNDYHFADGSNILHLAIQKNYPYIQELLANNPQLTPLLEEPNKEGKKPIFLAQNKTIILKFLERGLSPQTQDSNGECLISHLKKLLNREDIIALLQTELDKGEWANCFLISAFIDQSTVNTRSLTHHWTPMHIAAMQGDLAALNKLILWENNVNALDLEGKSPLFYAQKKLDIITALILHGANPFQMDANLNFASNFDSIEKVLEKLAIDKLAPEIQLNYGRYLIAKEKTNYMQGITPSFQRLYALFQIIPTDDELSVEGWNVLHIGLAAGQPQDVLHLLTLKPSLLNQLNQLNELGETPIFLTNDAPTALKLLEHGASIAIKNKQGLSYLDKLIKQPAMHNVQFLMALELDKKERASLPALKKLIQAGASVDTQGTNFLWTAAHVAAKQNDVLFVKALSAKRADFNKLNIDLHAPIYYVLRLNEMMIEALIEAGAYYTQKGPGLYYPFNEEMVIGTLNKLASFELDRGVNARFDQLAFLMQKGATLNISSLRLQSPITTVHVAASEVNNPLALDFIIQHAAEINCKIGVNPLWLAQNADTAFALIHAGALSNMHPREKKPIITHLQNTFADYADVFKQLEPLTSPDNILTAELDKRESANLYMVLALVTLGAYVNAQGTHFGWSTAHLAVFKNNIPALLQLIKQKVNLNLPTKTSGCTPISLTKDKHVISSLMQGGANPLQIKTGGDFVFNFNAFDPNLILLFELERGRNARWDLVLSLIQKCNASPFIVSQKNDNLSVLHLAARTGNQDAISLIYSLKDCISHLKNEANPLFCAANQEVVIALLMCGASLRCKDSTGKELFALLSEQFPNLVSQLPKMEWNKNIEEILSFELDRRSNGNMSLIVSLIRAGAPVNTQGKETGFSAAHVAVCKNDILALNELVHFGIELNLRTKNSLATPISFHGKTPNLGVLHTLIQGGANPLLKNHYQRHVVQFTPELLNTIFSFELSRLEKARLNILQDLIQLGANPSTIFPGVKPISIMHVAALHSSHLARTMISALAGEVPFERGDNNPLLLAKNEETARALKESGAVIDPQDAGLIATLNFRFPDLMRDIFQQQFAFRG